MSNAAISSERWTWHPLKKKTCPKYGAYLDRDFVLRGPIVKNGEAKHDHSSKDLHLI